MAGTRPHRVNLKHCQWSQEDMEAALSSIRAGLMGVSAASREYNIPRNTIADRIKKKVSSDTCTPGRRQVLTTEQENDLLKFIEYMAGRGFPLTINQIMMYAWCIDKMNGRKAFGNSGPSRQWWHKFKKRHAEFLRLRKPDRLDRGRAISSTVTILRDYFQLLKRTLDEHGFHLRPEDVYNCDESMIDLNKSTQRVIIPSRNRSAHSRDIASSEHISIHCCVSAAGSAQPPFLIFKGAIPRGNFTLDGPDGAIYGRSDSGFMDGELFLTWFKKIFIKYSKPTPERKVLLLLDGHASHCTVPLIQCAIDNNVILLALPPHTTHICQPLDVAVYKSLKCQITKIINLGKALRGSYWVNKKDVPRVIKVPFEQSMTIFNIKSGFRKCGIYPFNPNAIDKTQLLRNQLIPNIDIDLSLPASPEVPVVEEVDISPLGNSFVLEDFDVQPTDDNDKTSNEQPHSTENITSSQENLPSSTKNLLLNPESELHISKRIVNSPAIDDPLDENLPNISILNEDGTSVIIEEILDNCENIATPPSLGHLDATPPNTRSGNVTPPYTGSTTTNFVSSGTTSGIDESIDLARAATVDIDITLAKDDNEDPLIDFAPPPLSRGRAFRLKKNMPENLKKTDETSMVDDASAMNQSQSITKSLWTQIQEVKNMASSICSTKKSDSVAGTSAMLQNNPSTQSQLISLNGLDNSNHRDLPRKDHDLLPQSSKPAIPGPSDINNDSGSKEFSSIKSSSRPSGITLTPGSVLSIAGPSGIRNKKTPPGRKQSPTTSKIPSTECSSSPLFDASLNPLVACGIISESTASILIPPQQEILPGRKRPLRIRSKARVMTAQDIVDDELEQKKEILEKESKRQKKVTSSIAKGKGSKRGRGRGKKVIRSLWQSSSDEEDILYNSEDHNCHQCQTKWDEDNLQMQKLWVGCDARHCIRWICPRCLPKGFNYKTNYYCNECT